MPHSLKENKKKTRPDTRPIQVADGWAGAEMPVFPLFNSMIPDGPTDGRTDKASYRVACPQLKTRLSVTRNPPSHRQNGKYFDLRPKTSGEEL